jgi:crossover junction endodeoxyribonuclease RuvC
LRILGVDPGLSCTGYGIVEINGSSLKNLIFGGIRTSPANSFPEKLLNIYTKINQVILEYQPDFCAIESVFYHQNKKTAIIMGHARGIVLLAAAQNGITVFEYSPREIKMSIVGMGAASKLQVQAMVKTILHLAEPPHPDDASDALAVALCHHHRMKFRQLTQHD